ncbi:hypothetical protein STIAU_4654, partial [Stigmatella aurantiaca DW4/3-1]
MSQAVRHRRLKTTGRTRNRLMAHKVVLGLSGGNADRPEVTGSGLGTEGSEQPSPFGLERAPREEHLRMAGLAMVRRFLLVERL